MFPTTGRLPERLGNRHPATAPYDCFKAVDGYVVIGVGNNQLFRSLVTAMGVPELGRDPRYKSPQSRLERHDDPDEQALASAINNNAVLGLIDARHARNFAENSVIELFFHAEDYAILGVEPGDKVLRRVEGDDFPVVDDGHAVAQVLGFFHVVGCQENCLSPVSDALHHFPHRPPRLRIEAGRQFVQKNEFGVVDEGQADEQALLLAPRELAERSFEFIGEAEEFDERPPFDGFPVE